MCGAPKQGGALAGIDLSTQTVIQGSVWHDGAPVAGAYVRLLNQDDEFTAEVVALFRTAYEAEGMTLVDGFARFLYAFLGDTPLVLLSSDNQALKGLASDILAREAADVVR